MKLFDVYSQYDVEPMQGKGCHVFDKDGNEYLDFYGGHAVISIGHAHPHYVHKISEQVNKMGFYSNAVKNTLQQELANKLEENSGIKDYSFFLCNSGAEANENAIKLASFHNGKTKIVALEKGFHGRTSAAVRATHKFEIQAPINQTYDVEYVPMNDLQAMQAALESGDICAVIIEAIQGIGGCYTCNPEYLQEVYKICTANNAIMIMDEIQAGYGRSGKFFAYQYADFRPHIITTAKGMGNGFPIAGVLIDEETFESKKGMLGTTFGGNHLACAAGIAVLDVIKEEDLVENAKVLGQYFRDQLKEKIDADFEILGQGLMIGLKFKFSTGAIRKSLLFEEKIFSGSSGDPNIMRILPPLNIKKEDIDQFVSGLSTTLKKVQIEAI